jgi:hypothetical protein
MMHIVYPNAYNEKEFCGCVRYLSLPLDQAPPPPYDSVRLATLTSTLTDIELARQYLIPNWRDRSQGMDVYARSDKSDIWPGDSLDLAYLLASIRCVRPLVLETLEDAGDVWCTGVIRVLKEDGPPMLEHVDDGPFQAKLNGFITQPSDRFFLVPDANFRFEHSQLCHKHNVRVLSLSAFEDALQAARALGQGKVVIPIKVDELPLLVDLFFFERPLSFFPVDVCTAQALKDIGLSALWVAWLSQEAKIEPLKARLIIKTLALLAHKAGETVGTSLLALLRQQPFYEKLERRRGALRSYIDEHLRADGEVRKILAGQRSAKIDATLAGFLTQDLRAVIMPLADIQYSLKSRTVFENLFKPQPDLQIHVFDDEDPNGLNRFWYGAQRTPFLGRTQEMDALEKFLATDKLFCWWMVTGDGGVGKSRLALELCLRNGNVWRAGFLPSESSPEDYSHWEPNQPTLIIADYAAFRADELGKLVRRMKTHADSGRVRHPVRLLLLERNITKYYDGEAHEVDIREEAWFKSFLGAGRTVQNMTRAVCYAKAQAPIMLRALPPDETWKIICTFGQEKVQEQNKGRILDALKKIDPLCRPLYAALLGDAIGAGRDYERWGTFEVLRDILEREEDKFWIPAWDLERITNKEDREHDKDVLALATMAGDIDTESTSLPPAVAAMIQKESFSPKRYARMATGSTNTLLRSLKPDVLGEMFVLEHLKPENSLRTGRVDRLRDLAWSLSAANMQSFLARVEYDFPDHPTRKYLRTLRGQTFLQQLS